jgi:hypothetical protein
MTQEPGTTFRASLSTAHKFLTGLIIVGSATLFGASVVGDIIKHAPWFMFVLAALLPITLAVAYAFRPSAYRVCPDRIEIARPKGAIPIFYSEIAAVKALEKFPRRITIGLFRSSGFFGVFGIFWSSPWGVFRIYVTDGKKLVEIVRRDGRRVIISPDERDRFLALVRDNSRASGVMIATE